MIEVPVYNAEGQQVETVEVDETVLGGWVRPALLKQAVVMYQANRRRGTAATRSRGMVSGSTRKIYRQKGTGNARMGSVRSPIRRGGGVAFAKRPRDFSQSMPKRMKRLARNNAILAKLQSNDLLVIDRLRLDRPRTRLFVSLLQNLKIAEGCVVVLAEADEVVYKSGRNIPKTDIRPVEQLNAFDILRRRKLLFTKEALLRVLAGPAATTAVGA